MTTLEYYEFLKEVTKYFESELDGLDELLVSLPNNTPRPPLQKNIVFSVDISGCFHSFEPEREAISPENFGILKQATSDVKEVLNFNLSSNVSVEEMREYAIVLFVARTRGFPPSKMYYSRVPAKIAKLFDKILGDKNDK
jgi:hypothetical protein